MNYKKIINQLVNFIKFPETYMFFRKKIFGRHIVVFVYHRVHPAKGNARVANICPEEFEKQIRYLKENFDISIGSAEENFIKLSNIIFEKMIPSFLKNEPILKKQQGDIVTFKRRKPEDSNLEKLNTFSLNKLYDFIRMLDAEGYPKAYLDLENIKIEFSEVHFKNRKLVGRFEVIENE